MVYERHSLFILFSYYRCHSCLKLLQLVSLYFSEAGLGESLAWVCGHASASCSWWNLKSFLFYIQSHALARLYFQWEICGCFMNMISVRLCFCCEIFSDAEADYCKCSSVATKYLNWNLNCLIDLKWTLRYFCYWKIEPALHSKTNLNFLD